MTLDVVARMERVIEALEDGEYELALQILEDLLEDIREHLARAGA